MSGSASGASGGGHEPGGGWRPLKKKQKGPRMPKRGPGVAELEKILQQQEGMEMGMNLNKSKVDVFSSSWTTPHEFNHHASLPTPFSLKMKPQTLCPSSSQTKNITPFSTQVDIFHPSHQQLETLYANDCSQSGFRHSDDGNQNVGYTVSNDITLPDKVTYPTIWSSAESSTQKNGLKYDSSYMSFQQLTPNFHSTCLFQRNKKECASSMMSPFPNTFSSPIPPQPGRNSQVEPPSNQRSYWNMDRSWLPQEKLKLHELSTCNHRNVHDYDPPVPRERKSAYCNTIELNSKSSTVEYREFTGNYLMLGPPAMPSAATKFLGENSTSRAFSSPHQYIEELDRSLQPREAAQDNRFYSFLQPKEPVELEGDSGKCDGTGKDSIDLSLRL